MERLYAQCPENFYPRPPRGGRRRIGGKTETGKKFLSTPSARRATKLQQAMDAALKISIHALREEGDVSGPVLVSTS